MYYEIYVDSLFLVNFVMNLYLLLLVNQSTFRTATRLRLLSGAAVGAILYMVPFLWNGPPLLKYGIGIVTGTAGMLFTAFCIHSVRAFGRLVEMLLLWSLLMGGVLLFLIKRVPFVRNSMSGIFGIIGVGTVFYLWVTYWQEHRRKKNNICSVTLIRGDVKLKVSALIDSGNSLVEPISGKPVSIIETHIFKSLWKEPPPYYRAIPFHSIGKKRGILQGYLLPEIRIEWNGVEKVCRDVYIAVCDEQISGSKEDLEPKKQSAEQAIGIRMLLNPILFEKQEAV